MTRLSAGLVLIALVIIAPLSARADWSPVVEPYLRIQVALAGDTLDNVGASATAIADQAAKLGTEASPVVAAARTVAGARDLEAARAAFATLSDALIAAAGDELADDIRVAYCPMAESSWLQKGDSIRNPYYGKQMLTCGEFKK